MFNYLPGQKASLRLVILFYLYSFAVQGQQRIEGRVQTESGAPLGGVTITLLNTNQGTVTAANGTFVLSKLANGQYTLSISSVGYATQTRLLTIPGPATLESITLAENDNQLGEVIVTSEKIETDVQRTPLAVSVLTARQLRDYRVWSFNDMSALAPSLLITEHGNSTASLFINIRGVMGLHSQTAVATYIDGVYQFETFSVPLQFNNVERIEVLRGPQGTLYGRNAFGGAINIVTKKPSNKTEAYAEVGLGNYAQQRYSASFSIPIVPNKLFLGVSGTFSQRSGIYTNTVTNSAFDRPQSIAGGLNLRYLFSDRWAVDVNGRFEQNADKGSYPWVSSDSTLFASPYTVGRNSENLERRSNVNVSAVVRYRGRHVNLDAVSAVLDYQKWFPQGFDGDFTPVDLRTVYSDDHIRTYTQEVRVSSNTNLGGRFNWTVGTFLWTSPKGTNVNNTVSKVLTGSSTAVRNSLYNNNGMAFFGQATYRLTNRLTALAGLRFDRETRKLGQDRSTIQPNGAVTVNNLYTDFATTFGAVTPKVSLSYELSAASLLYVQYARGFRAGGLNAFAPTFDDVPYGPEYSDNYEVGFKNTLLDNRLRVNLTGFLLAQRNQQINVIENGFFLIRNTGSMNNLGAEIEVMALPTRRVQVEWNASLSDARYARLTANVNGSNRDLTGNKPLFNPGAASFLAVQYRYPLRGQASIFVRGEQRYTGAYYLNFDNVIRQSPFILYNARAGVTVKNVELAVWGRNLTDVQYRTWATTLFLLSNPRMWGVTLSSRF